jgi:hypothetical protein
MASYHVIGCDNRGTWDCPFGRVYLARTKKGNIVGSLGYGANKDNPKPLAVWRSTDTPDKIDLTTSERAGAFLATTYPHLAKKVAA